jgi:rhodanese-related sulfurtransferase
MKRLSFPAILLAASLGFGAPAAAQESPTTVEGATTVDAAAAKALFDKGVAFVDVRTNELFKTSRIPGATHLELFTAFKQVRLAKLVAKDKPVVIYCAGPGCKRSSKACVKAVKWGCKTVYYFRGGLPAWKAAGYPTDPP